MDERRQRDAFSRIIKNNTRHLAWTSGNQGDFDMKNKGIHW